jgi:AcrR family transcriptional regulator
MSSAITLQAEARPGGKRAQTREKLLDVAAELFQARGIAAVSLDEVAAQAGLTKGAIYGNFAGKDDLVFAVAYERIERVLVSFDGEAPVREQLHRIVRESFGRHAARRVHFAFLAELDLYTLTREDLARRFIDQAQERHLQSAAHLEKFRDELKLSPLQFAITAHALVTALRFQHACFPEVVTEDAAITALEGLLK